MDAEPLTRRRRLLAQRREQLRILHGELSTKLAPHKRPVDEEQVADLRRLLEETSRMINWCSRQIADLDRTVRMRQEQEIIDAYSTRLAAISREIGYDAETSY